jgi:probable HAF family extracellular repeat protein
MGLAGMGVFAQTPIIFDVRGAEQTLPMNINKAGEIAGYYIDSSGNAHGFERFANGVVYAPIDAPGAIETLVLGLNNMGRYGVLGGGKIKVNGQFHGFTSRSNPLSFTQFDVPASVNTEISDVNDNGNFAGAYESTSGVTYGFVKVGGVLTPFQVNGRTTFSAGMNIHNDLVGSFYGQTQRGFIRKANGAITQLNPPGSQASAASGINDAGQVVGYFDGSDHVTHGFFGLPGKLMKSFDIHGAQATFLTGINNPGSLTGYFIDGQGALHGFLVKKQ